MNPNRDTSLSKQVSLGDIVELCSNCTSLCASKVQRVVSNASRPPKGWENEWGARAKEDQKDEMDKCMVGCNRVHTQCPPAREVRLFQGESVDGEEAPTKGPWWKFGLGGSKPVSSSTAVVTDQGISICENSAAEFAQVLFMLAHKPTKISFSSMDPKSGDTYDPETGSWATNAKTVDYDRVIKDRWNTAVQGGGKAEAPPQPETQGSGTVPKW